MLVSSLSESETDVRRGNLTSHIIDTGRRIRLASVQVALGLIMVSDDPKTT